MKITKEQLKNIVRETLQEESEYQTFFKKALEKAGKSIPSMSDEEKKAFFNKIEKTWKGRGQKSEGNAFGAAVAQAKKDGDDTFKVGDKEYKTERFGRGQEGGTFGSEEESLDELTKAQEKLPPALKKAIEKKEESVKESTINEISAKKGLEQVVKGNTKEVEGIKVSKEMAQAMLDWFSSSPYGRKYPKAQNARLHVSIGVMLSFGLDRYAKHKGAKEELKYLKTFKESVNEMDPYLKPTPKDDEEVDESVNEAISKTLKYRSRIAGDIFIEIEEDPAGIFVDVRMKGKNYNALLSTTDIEYPSGHIKVTPRVKNIPIKESVGESVNEGYSTEEKRIVMMAVRKIAKYMNRDLKTALRYVIGAAQELEKSGKVK